MAMPIHFMHCNINKTSTSRFIYSIANLISKLVYKHISLSTCVACKSSNYEGEYEKVFMKLWRSERPYVFSPGNGKLDNYVTEARLKYLPKLRIKDQEEQMLKPRTAIGKFENQKSKINKLHVTDRIESFNGFKSKGIKPDLIKILYTLGIKEPLPIQALSLPHVFGDNNLIIQSETGSGKTLAYLLPILQKLGTGKRCGTIIAVPTRELAHQVMAEAYKFIEDKNIIGCYVNTSKIKEQVEQFESSPPKILIGTPKHLLEIVKKHEQLFKNTTRVVLDEVDKMLPPIIPTQKKKTKTRMTHPKPLEYLIPMINSVARKPQLIACSATVSREMVDDLIVLGFSERVKVIKPDVYSEKTRVVPNCINHQYIIVDESKEYNKIDALVRHFKTSGSKSMLLFIQRGLSVQDYVDELKQYGLEAVAFYKEIESGEGEVMDKFFHDFKSGKIQVAVATEEEVRGLDFKELSDVYLMDVPKDIDEYLHLAGRVGRVGLPGTVTTMISYKSADSLIRFNLFCSDLNVQCQQKII